MKIRHRHEFGENGIAPVAFILRGTEPGVRSLNAARPADVFGAIENICANILAPKCLILRAR